MSSHFVRRLSELMETTYDELYGPSPSSHKVRGEKTLKGSYPALGLATMSMYYLSDKRRFSPKMTMLPSSSQTDFASATLRLAPNLPSFGLRGIVTTQ
jgi:hypothetical protein